MSDPSKVKNVEELYRLIRANDFANYYTNVQQKDRLTYRIIYKTYNGFSKSVFSLGKKTLGAVRGRKNG
jgi:hypothetical protein